MTKRDLVEASCHPAVPARERRPKLLLVHGFLSSPASWERLRRHLAGVAETVAPALPGYWAEPAPPPPAYRLEALAESIEPTLEREQPTHILGHSMGALVALELARRHPRRFQRTGVIGLPVFQSRSDALAFLRQRGLAHRLLLRSDDATHVLCRALYAVRWGWAPALPWILPGFPLAHVHGAFRHTRAGHAGALDGVVFSGNAADLARAVADPVVALHSIDDRAAPPGRARDLARECGWDFTLVPSGRHQLMITRPRLVARWVRTALLGEGGFSEASSPPTLGG